jgi:O-antigen/teichoic acid export membrane protein
MMAQLAMPLRRVPGLLDRVRSDSLVRNSLYLMASTVVTAILGYAFWGVAAHEFTKQQVGIGSAVISLCSTLALFTYLGPSFTLIERLPANEQSPRWTIVLARTCLGTAAVTAAATALAIPLLLRSHDYRSFFDAALPIVIAVLGAAACTVVNLFCGAFVAARRAGRFLSIQTLISVAKLALLLPLAVAGAGATALVDAWVASSLLGVCAGAGWLIPRMGLGRRPGYRSRRRAAAAARAAATAGPAGERWQARHRRAGPETSSQFLRRLAGQHLTSVGAATTPLILPVLVVLRLGVTPNAYFYVTEMVGSAFFLVSPSVSVAIFAEGVRAGADLRDTVIRAFRLITILLTPAIVVMVAGGRLILGLFGASYAAAGYGLLVLLAAAAVPDAVSNIAVAVFRVRRRLGYSSALNLGMLVVTLAGAWVLMPRLGIAGAGVAWLGAQILGAIASLPAFADLREPVPA